LVAGLVRAVLALVADPHDIVDTATVAWHTDHGRVRRSAGFRRQQIA
jgi:hypothetical protein